jgi:hypothetical protein
LICQYRGADYFAYAGVYELLLFHSLCPAHWFYCLFIRTSYRAQNSPFLCLTSFSVERTSAVFSAFGGINDAVFTGKGVKLIHSSELLSFSFLQICSHQLMFADRLFAPVPQPERTMASSCSRALKSFFGIKIFDRRSRDSSSRPSSSPPKNKADSARVAWQFKDIGIWRDAPVLTGTAKFPPLDDAKNILITGGAGFMSVLNLGPAN